MNPQERDRRPIRSADLEVHAAKQDTSFRLTEQPAEVPDHAGTVPVQHASVPPSATLVDLLGDLHRTGEHVSVSHRDPAGVFRSRIVPAGVDTYITIAEHISGDVWHGVNPVRAAATGRGTAADVTRLAALWADLDVKPGAMASMEDAEAVITDLSVMLNTPPAYVVHTGHGLHPYWLLDDDEHLQLTTDLARDAAVALLARWRRLVTRVAAAHDGTVDAVFDLPRVLRSPGTTNHKAEPVPVRVQARGGYPLDVDAVQETFRAYGIEEWPEDRQTLGDVVTARTNWPTTTHTCGYVHTMIDAWTTDAPAPGGGRHHWAFNRLIRLACARRLGCVTDTDFTAAANLLQRRLDQLRAHDGLRPGEVAADLPYAFDVAERKSDEQARGELGGHTHEPSSDLLDLIASSTPMPPAAAPAPETPVVDVDAFAVAEEVRKLRIRDRGRTAYALEKAATDPADPFDAGLLAEILARPPEPPHRVEGLIPSNAATLVVAQRKTGKTTFNLNLARALLTGEDFLGRFAVEPIVGRVSILNFEVAGAQLARWAADVGLDPDRLHLVNLRGRRNPLAHPADRAVLAQLLHSLNVETLIVDPFSGAYVGQSQNDAGEVGAWLRDLDLFARTEVGAHDLILNAHAGWDAERTRGASALEDWADSIVTLTKGKDDDDGRYMRAIGRDVDVDEDGLTYDPITRTLSMAGTGSRRAKVGTEKVAFLVSAVHGVVSASPGVNGTEVGDILRRQKVAFRKGEENKALSAAVEQGILRFDTGARGAKLYYPIKVPHLPHVPPRPPAGEPVTSPGPLFIGGPGGVGSSNPDLPRSTHTTAASS